MRVRVDGVAFCCVAEEETFVGSLGRGGRGRRRGRRGSGRGWVEKFGSSPGDGGGCGWAGEGVGF